MAVKKSKKSGAAEQSVAVKEEIMPSKKAKKTPVDIQKLVSEAASLDQVKPAAAPKARKAAAKPAEAKADGIFVVIDYPQESEIVSGLSYTMKIGAKGDGIVEIMVNDGDWKPARHSGGYWWFDWGYYKPGPHTITARLVKDGKLLKKSSVRKCTVK